MARQMKDSGIEWIGEIPESWNTIRFKYLHNGMNTGEAIDKENWTSDENDKIFYTAGLVPIRTNYADFPDWKFTTENDLLLARNGTPYVYYPHTGACYTDHIIRAMLKQGCCKRFIQYSLQQSIASVVVETVSIATWSASLWNEQVIAWPSVSEQHRIASFLDRKCAEIDAVIERTKATIEEYKKLKQAIITEAVTKGVRGSGPMKDSRIEWIGEIPEGWESSKLGGVTLSMRNGYVGPTRDLFFETGIRYIQSLHIKDGVIDFDKHPYYVAEEWANEHPKVHTNDILIVQTGDIGQVGIVEPEYDGCNCHALIIATPDCALLSPRYLMFYLMSIPGKELLLSYKTGALLPHLNAGKIKFTPVLLPALDEQNEIAFYLAEKCAALDTLIAKKTALLTELETYKKSLIYEYVTGKKEVE